MLHITAEDLDANPEYGVGILNYELHERRRRDPYRGIDDPLDKAFRELEFNWISGEKYGSQAFKKPVFEDGYLVQSGKRGRPVSPARTAAIKGLVLKLYLQKPWLEITKRVCPCGESHGDPNKVVALCQPKLDAQVVFLRRLLKRCDIQLFGQLPARAIMPYD
jgi:hypothetical protein